MNYDLLRNILFEVNTQQTSVEKGTAPLQSLQCVYGLSSVVSRTDFNSNSGKRFYHEVLH